MKITDYCPRAAPLDSYLKGKDLVGIEVGVDVGAHAEALLLYCNIAFLHLVDIWPNTWMNGYCAGRLARFKGRFAQHHMESLKAAKMLSLVQFDFVYLDQEHDGETVSKDLEAWWPLLKAGGILGHRNYIHGRKSHLDVAVERFVEKNKIETKYDDYCGELILFK